MLGKIAVQNPNRARSDALSSASELSSRVSLLRPIFARELNTGTRREGSRWCCDEVFVVCEPSVSTLRLNRPKVEMRFAFRSFRSRFEPGSFAIRAPPFLSLFLVCCRSLFFAAFRLQLPNCARNAIRWSRATRSNHRAASSITMEIRTELGEAF